MKRITPAVPSYWKELLQRDDRSWVEILKKQGYSPDNSDSSPIPLLMDIVTSVEFQGHSANRFVVPTESVRNLAEKFWHYLNESQSFETLSQDWKNDTQGPWSLPFFLIRRIPPFIAFYRRHPTSRQYIETPEESEILGVLEKSVLSAFQAMTETLPLQNHLRLVYQLHMEGLLDNEISPLLGIPRTEVKKSLQSAKKILKGEILSPKKGYGA